ncbi:MULTISPECIES: terminase small subunit [unclassified Pseudomonas]|uniref:terminase small subunit n=1 Tax=unclassified Pseudomonas TaxID=196821 RepID=UPI00131EBA30|nr:MULTISPECIES: terminase small subunit [unclassified Pseudomonas]
MSLTPKKVAFIEAIRGGASNKDAAIAAGYSAKTASAAGSRMAKDPDVMLELHKLNALFPNGGGVKADVKAGVKAERPKRAPKTTAEPAAGPADEPADDSADEDESAGFDLAKALTHSDPKDFLLAVMNDGGTEPKLRVDAAKALMPFIHQRRGEGGKKEQAKDKANAAAGGKFGPRQPPQLRSVPGGRP